MERLVQWSYFTLWSDLALCRGSAKITEIGVISGLGESGRPRRPHTPEIGGSNPSPATKKGGIMKRPLFFSKKGYWGEDGYVRISFCRYLWETINNEYVLKVRWVCCL